MIPTIFMVVNFLGWLGLNKGKIKSDLTYVKEAFIAAPLFLKALLFSLFAIFLGILFLYSKFYWWRPIIVFGMLITFGLAVLIVVAGTLYLPQVERYFRENNMHVFFNLRRKFILYGLILNAVILPVVLMPVFKFLFDLVGAWDGFWAAPLFFGNLIFYPIALITNLYLLGKVVFEKGGIGPELNRILENYFGINKNRGEKDSKNTFR